jgi:hypothetical protein
MEARVGLETVRARDGVILVPLREGEMEQLLREGCVVNARFGIGGAALIANQCKSALPLLAQWRGFAFDGGAGI